ncbi:MAG: helix-hairpin-helix domain-containing protein [Halobacteriales archaeon]
MRYGEHVPPGLKKKSKPKSSPKPKPSEATADSEQPPFSLIDLPGVGPKKAEVLSEAGFTTLDALSKASEDDLCALPGISTSYANQLKSTIETLLKQNKK